MAKAEKLKKEGKNIINLGIGQPDFTTPSHITEAAIKAIKDGEHGYTSANGILKLREAVAKDILLRKKCLVSPDNIIIVPGGKVTMWHAIMIFGSKNKEIIYPNPGFPIYESAIKYSGAKAVPLKLNINNDFKVSAEILKKLITKNTNLLILNSPSNPTGNVINKKEMDKIVSVLLENPQVHVLSDEIYSRIIYKNSEFVSMLEYPEIKDRVILLDGWSKTFAMTGWRIGYSVWPTKYIEISQKLNINSFSCTNTPTQYAAIAALEGPQECVKNMVNQFYKRKNLIESRLNKIKGFKCSKSSGAFYCLPSIKETKLTSSKIEEILLYKLGIASVAGTSFGKFGEGYLRFSYANSESNIIEAMNRIENFENNESWEC